MITDTTIGATEGLIVGEVVDILLDGGLMKAAIKGRKEEMKEKGIE